MIKGLLVTTIFLGQVMASAAPIQAMGLKDFKMTSLSSNKTELLYKGETLIVERVGSTHFKLNGKDVIFKNTDTLEAVYDKTQAAYRASGKKSAALDGIFIPRAHATPPPLFMLLFGGLLGGAIGHAAGQRQCEERTGYNGSATTEGAPRYDEPIQVDQ
jgi:hypothetical protein